MRELNDFERRYSTEPEVRAAVDSYLAHVRELNALTLLASALDSNDTEDALASNDPHSTDQ